MFTARITQARYDNKFFYLQSGAMAAVAKPKAQVYSGPSVRTPSSLCTVCEEENPIYGRVYCSALFDNPSAPGGLSQLPLQLNDEVDYEVVNGNIFLQSIRRLGAGGLPPPPAARASGIGPLLPPVGPVHGTYCELTEIGFINIAQWIIDRNGQIAHEGDDPAGWADMCSNYPQALYAFCIDEKIKYIGKTISTLRSRFSGYRNPGKTTATNRRCNTEISKALQVGKIVRILVLPNRTPLMWGRFPINVAAGLEDALIDDLQPDWNAT